VGVPATKIDHMFDAFFQVQEGQVSGTGLGLFGVRQRAEGLDGTCGARHNTTSLTGSGTVMWFAISYRPDHAADMSVGLPRIASQCSLRSFDLTTVEASSMEPVMPKSPGTGLKTSAMAAARSIQLTLAAPSDLAKRTADYNHSKELTAMVVDDTPTVRKLMKRLLLKMGFVRVASYENGSKGLDAMVAGQVDIVFSDVQMPIMTGPEVDPPCSVVCNHR
jgi:CheY-like chemotaxis protein